MEDFVIKEIYYTIGYKMKYIITLIFILLFVSCDCKKSVQIDKRCYKIKGEASKKGYETGVCYKPAKGEFITASDRPHLDPDHEACKAIRAEAQKKCDALPPLSKDDIEWLSGSFFGGC